MFLGAANPLATKPLRAGAKQLNPATK